MKPEAKYFNRELSWLQFNRRVLEEALDPRVPLAERAKFLAIVSNNLDEFVMVRLAGLQKERGETGLDAAGYSTEERLTLVQQAIRRQLREQYDGLAELAPLLAANGVSLVRISEWTDSERLSMKAYFRETLEPILTPLAVGPEQPFPLVRNLTLYLALKLVRTEPDGDREDVRYALLPVPSSERRVVSLGGGRFALLEEVLAHCAEEILPGFRVESHAAFRVTRDGTFDIDEDNANDLLSEIEEGVWLRAHGAAVRLEVDAGVPTELVEWLREELEVSEHDTLFVDGPLDLTFLFGIAALGPRIRARQFEPHRPVDCPVDWEDPFAAIKQGGLLLHHPYESFLPVVEFVKKAAQDPKVVAIKQTLYRVSGDSPIVEALIAAADAGKQVTVLCELKARFDERRNIVWARRLEQAGAHVLYGVLGYKVHAKLLLVIRREESGIRRYVHIGTGNYNDRTARLYEDFSYLTADPAVCGDVSRLFNMLTGFSRPPEWQRLLVAPLTFRARMEAWIDREISHAKNGKPARIFGKMNSLVDTRMCDKLYAASEAGVRVDLVVRGMCVLRPQVPGLSENIRVTSVVGRFLEHSRLYYFQNAGKPVYVVGSADWMTRNLDRRVESLVRVEEPAFKAGLDGLIQSYIDDRRSSRVLQADGGYVHLGTSDDVGVGVQELLAQHAAEADKERKAEHTLAAFTPARKPSDDVYG